MVFFSDQIRQCREAVDPEVIQTLHAIQIVLPQGVIAQAEVLQAHESRTVDPGQKVILDLHIPRLRE